MAEIQTAVPAVPRTLTATQQALLDAREALKAQKAALAEAKAAAVAERADLPATSYAILRRPKKETGFWSWFTTVDHKKIGILYIAFGLLFFVIAGIEALLIRLQLAGPNGTVLTAGQYNAMFTMHGTTMVFLVGMPMAVAFGNYLIPIMIGAPDMAFPRLNNISFWLIVPAFILLLLSLFVEGPAGAYGVGGGWTMYPPLSTSGLSNGRITSSFQFGAFLLFSQMVLPFTVSA